MGNSKFHDTSLFYLNGMKVSKKPTDGDSLYLFMLSMSFYSKKETANDHLFSLPILSVGFSLGISD